MKELYNFDEIMKPFWKSDIMFSESVLMVAENGEPAAARLLFKPVKILSVKNSHLNTEYFEGKDWVYENGFIKLTGRSKAYFLTYDELYPSEPKEGWTFPKVGGGNILFQEGHYFHDLQLSVTYMYSGREWTGPTPVIEIENLKKTISKLQDERTVKIILYGDSISAGYNASGFTSAPPYQPHWGEMFVKKLRNSYKAEIQFLNPSVGGKTSEWGLENIEENVSKHMPDFVVLAFGMNDGTGRVKPETFKDNIRSMMDNISRFNPDAEFILVASMLPNNLAALPGNPDIGFWGEQENYKEALDQLSGKGVAIADMTSVHRELLRHKSYCDMTGNNVNHPNDFLSRWYAQVISATLTEK